MKITAKLVHKNNYQRFYELSSPLLRGRHFNEDVDIPLELESVKEKRLREEYKDKFRTDGAHIICVSDAHTHTERLVFTAEKMGDVYSRTSVQIDGKHTFLIDGGDYDSIYPDEVYLRHLAMINGFSLVIDKQGHETIA